MCARRVLSAAARGSVCLLVCARLPHIFESAREQLAYSCCAQTNSLTVAVPTAQLLLRTPTTCGWCAPRASCPGS